MQNNTSFFYNFCRLIFILIKIPYSISIRSLWYWFFISFHCICHYRIWNYLLNK